MRPNLAKIAFIALALLFVGAGCSGVGQQLGGPAQEDRCKTMAQQREQNDLAGDPGMTPLSLESHFNATLGVCLFSDEYRGKSKSYPRAVWVVDRFIIDLDHGQKLGEYLTVDGTQMSTLSLEAFDGEKDKLFKQ